MTYIMKPFCSGEPANSSGKVPKASPSAGFPQAKQEWGCKQKILPSFIDFQFWKPGLLFKDGSKPGTYSA